MDYKLFKLINQLAGRSFWVDKLMILISNRARYLYLFAILFLLICKGRNKEVGKNAVYSMCLAYLVNLMIRIFSYKPRPFVKHRVGILKPCKMDSSFPSKHTLLVFAVSTSIIMYKKGIGLVLSTLSLLTGLSRVWLGHHYPSDIIGSACIGSLISVVVDRFQNEKKKYPSH
ncbi:undecaprenyl-diphosphatase [Lottiidibacillus patelloidae]|uniref:Undecaprenyl-diphosphatase n=1 Tax=Lottiidibacillus patelloidae TaxID=2670334 RepID=A0A263BWK6_9BACI|nr:phosphatase PAP2 family protein [Lottiidibacillus patelloidae]OZM58094.1 undecaprenyl-diphosphatase [Lottiidibacillus patelloidae]